MIESGARTEDTIADFFWSVMMESHVIFGFFLAYCGFAALAIWS
jgi:hypothetical protein